MTIFEELFNTLRPQTVCGPFRILVAPAAFAGQATEYLIECSNCGHQTVGTLGRLYRAKLRHTRGCAECKSTYRANPRPKKQVPDPGYLTAPKGALMGGSRMLYVDWAGADFGTVCQQEARLLYDPPEIAALKAALRREANEEELW